LWKIARYSPAASSVEAATAPSRRDDGRTIEPLIAHLEANGLPKPQEIVYDRAAKGIHEVRGVQVSYPSKSLKTDTMYQKQKKRKKFRHRAAIEPVNAPLKTDFRMTENRLYGEKYIQLNALLSVTAWNFKKWMKKGISLLSKKWVTLFLGENRGDYCATIFRYLAA
jgi:IS5 family transposase